MRRLAGAIALASLVVSCTSTRPSTSPPAFSTSSTLRSTSAAVPHFAHIVVVVEENHGFTQIVGAPDAPYFNHLIKSGTLLNDSRAVSHPSEPNYLALFSGSTHNLTSDACPVSYAAPNLASALAAQHRTFIGYAESLPASGSSACTAGSYARKHAPWVDFADVPASASQPMSAFPSDFTRLPSVAFVVPNLDNDMHNGTIGQGDTWLRTHLDAYVRWASTHNSLLIITYDEDDRYEENRIPTVLVGAHVPRGGNDFEHIDHYALLRTIEDAFGAAPVGQSAARAPIIRVWK